MGTSLNGLTPAGTYPGLIKTGDNAPIDGTLKTLSDGNGNNLPMSVSTSTINLTGTAQVGGVAIANTTQVAAKQDTLVSGTNIKTINGTSLLGSGNIPVVTSPSGVAGAIQFSNGSAFASDAANLFWDDTNNWLGVGTNAPATALDLRGSLTIQRDATNFTMRLGSLGQINAYIDASTNNQFYLVDATFSNSFILNNLGTGFGVLPIASTKVAIKGTGSTSATTSLLVQNSAGTNTFKVQDDGAVLLGVTSTPRNDWALNVGGSLSLKALNSSADILGVYNNTTLSTYINGGGDIRTSGKIGVGSSALMTFQASAKLQIDSTTEGFLPPRMTTTQRDAIATPATGLKVYNTTTNTTDTYDGTTWQRFGQQTLIKGSGSTSATTSLLVQNSVGTNILKIGDGARIDILGTIGQIDFSSYYQLFSSGNLSTVGCYKGGQAFSVDGSRLCVNVATSSHSASASFQVDSTTTGILPPRMTTTQKNAIATPAAGLVVYDSTTNKLCCYNGSTWNDLF